MLVWRLPKLLAEIGKANEWRIDSWPARAFFVCVWAANYERLPKHEMYEKKTSNHDKFFWQVVKKVGHLRFSYYLFVEISLIVGFWSKFEKSLIGVQVNSPISFQIDSIPASSVHPCTTLKSYRHNQLHAVVTREQVHRYINLSKKKKT